MIPYEEYEREHYPKLMSKTGMIIASIFGILLLGLVFYSVLVGFN